MKLSVIIPVYKVEKTLDRCVESVLRQNVSETEIILIDDGSPDSCPKMCDEWARKDSCIKVLHQSNKGLGGARNAGLDIASGEYVTFVDSDDYLSDGIYETMFSLLEDNPQIDIIEFSVNCVGWEKIDVDYKNNIYGNAHEYWSKARAWNHAYACNKIFKKEVFESLRFPVGKLYEDLWILPEILHKAKVIATSSVKGYNYCVNPNAISVDPDSENLKQCLAAEQNAAEEMNAHWYREWHLYMCMLYRQVDIYRMSGEVILKWPFVRFICWIHKKTKGRGKVAHTV